MNSATEKRRNLRKIRTFGLHWEAVGAFDWIGKNIAIFPCRVRYHLKGKTRSVDTRMHMTHEGTIELYESDWLNVDDHYTGFDADWQRYDVTDNFALRVEGSGAKVNGSYWVEMTPLV